MFWGSILMMACNKEEATSKGSILDQVGEYQGYQRTVGEEEYKLYTYFVKREITGEVSKDELKKRVEDYANQINALFYLANKFGLCEPYSYETMKLRMEQENEMRKIKKEKGEAIYGLEEFSLEQFFQYKKDTTEASLRSYLEGEVDEVMIENAKAYYEENREKFRYRENIIYEETVKEQKEIVEADRTQLKLLGNADPALADFLMLGEVGESYSDVQNEGKREVVIKEILYNEEGFEANKQAAVSYYIQQELYSQLITMVAENNPVQFQLQ